MRNILYHFLPSVNRRNTCLPVIIRFSMAFALILALAACVSNSGTGKLEFYSGLGQSTDPVPLMAKVRTDVLPNGLRYYILENSRPENRAYLTLAVNAGSVLETDEEQGLAHFVEHMAFNGTRRFPEQELIGYLRSLGMRFGADANAFTSFDETVYGIDVPVETGEDGIKRIPDKALAIIDDWSHAINFAPADVDDERAVIMEESRYRSGAGMRVIEKTMSILYRGSRYAERSPIGLPEIIQNAPASRLENFYRTWYRTDNMAVILVGDFDGAELEAALTSHFTAAAPTTPLNKPVYELRKPQKNSFMVEFITDPEYPYPRIDLYYQTEIQPMRGDLAAYRQGLINSLIERMIALRIEEAMAKPETPYVAAGLWEDRQIRGALFYALAAVAKPGKVRESLESILREKESITRYGFTGAEIDRAKRGLISNAMRQVSEKDTQESDHFVSLFTSHFLENRYVPDVEWDLDAATALLPGIDAKEIEAAVKRYFEFNDITMIITVPETDAANLPDKAEVRRIIAASQRERIPRPKEATFNDELLDMDPDPGSIIHESLDAETGAILWDLSNGARVILKETGNKNNEIILYATARGGTTSAPESEEVSVNLAAEMMNLSGMGPYPRSELLQKLADKQVSISYWTGSFNRGFNGFSTSDDLKTLFELLYLGFTQPRFDPAAIEVLLDQYRTILDRRGESPEEIFSDEISRTVYGDNRFFRPLELADLEKVNIRAAQDFVRRTLGPQDYTFVFTGNLDIPVIRDYIETYLASIPQTWENMNVWDDPGIERPGQVEKTVYKGKEDKSYVYLGWFLPEKYGEKERAAALALTEYLEIVLNDEIREKRGGVYGITTQAALSPYPLDGELTLTSHFVCDPNRAVELSGAVIAQLERIAGGDIDADTFEKAKQALGQEWAVSMQSNSYIAQSYGNLAILLNLPLVQLNERPGLYGVVTPAEIQDICRRLLPGGPVRLILYPEGWKG
jgi:zinc protease